MASPPPGPPSWSVAVRLRHRWGLDIHAAAENVLPGWGRGGERLSLLLRFRRRLILTVTSQCGARPAVAPTQPGTPPRGGKILRFLRSRWAPLPRITSIWRRKKHTPTRASAAAAAPRGRRAQESRTPTQPGFLAMAGTPTSAAMRWFAVAAVVVASILVFRITMCIGCWNWRGGRDGERIARWAKFLELMEHPPPYHKYKWLLGVPKRGLEWIFSK
ncbi:hypothetical protein SETIT_5G117700v2 [Setaria italica]|uniref:Uncharacterized protein n=1 Tax=Setaria italica TaxID=4555 RepID=K3XLV0_SETIT|nr:uncharacterized protein LOC101780314 [Setaria italica]RCV24826.1 hypothetical protein SETIT_5G117700v2 [Setaria italica]